MLSIRSYQVILSDFVWHKTYDTRCIYDICPSHALIVRVVVFRSSILWRSSLMFFLSVLVFSLYFYPLFLIEDYLKIQVHFLKIRFIIMLSSWGVTSNCCKVVFYQVLNGVIYNINQYFGYFTKVWSMFSMCKHFKWRIRWLPTTRRCICSVLVVY